MGDLREQERFEAWAKRLGSLFCDPQNWSMSAVDDPASFELEEADTPHIVDLGGEW